jgi:hypothetical protein
MLLKLHTDMCNVFEAYPYGRQEIGETRETLAKEPHRSPREKAK